jgi:hypothetical protein
MGDKAVKWGAQRRMGMPLTRLPAFILAGLLRLLTLGPAARAEARR